jgi:hypothetical protein
MISDRLEARAASPEGGAGGGDNEGVVLLRELRAEMREHIEG